MAVLTDPSVKALMIAASDQTRGNEIATAINLGSNNALFPVGLIVATNVSTTIDFSSLLVGDRVVALAAGAGGAANGYVIATAGTLPAAAVVGSSYLVFRTLANALLVSQTVMKF